MALDDLADDGVCRTLIRARSHIVLEMDQREFPNPPERERDGAQTLVRLVADLLEGVVEEEPEEGVQIGGGQPRDCRAVGDAR